MFFSLFAFFGARWVVMVSLMVILSLCDGEPVGSGTPCFLPDKQDGRFRPDQTSYGLGIRLATRRLATWTAISLPPFPHNRFAPFRALRVFLFHFIGCLSV